MYSRAIYGAAVILLTCALASCSSGGATGDTGLDKALSQVADTASTRTQISYDDTAKLVQLAGAGVGNPDGFAPLRGWGAASISQLVYTVVSDTGVNVLNEDYSISAGSPPHTVTLLHGGQNASQVTDRLTKLGWKNNGGTLTGPALASGSRTANLYALIMHLVKPSGSDLTLGAARANLSQIGSPSGKTLADDPLVSALANCLGDVVAAQIGIGGNLGGKKPAGVAIGVRTPASKSATPRAVACVAWPTQAEATGFESNVRKALSHGLSPTANKPFSSLFGHPAVTSIGGSQNVIQWQADTPGRALLIFEMYESVDLPALPNCSLLPIADKARVIGCS
jgi:hypothetical protein